MGCGDRVTGRRSFTGVGSSPDGSVKGAGGGWSSSPLPVGTLALPGAPPLLCGEFLGWIEAATRQRGKPRLPKQCHPVPGSPFVQSWRRRPAGGGTEGSWASSQGRRRRSVGAVWRKLRAAICLCGGSELVDGDLQSRRKPSLVVHRASSGYVFGRRNLLGALSRGDGGILDVVTTVVASFSESCLYGVAIGLAAFGHA
uniref:Uncharacterized protein n=1 Tax=Oryza rufipogon TaxID=4529 RepID=A0A0E0RA36_ORYRU